MVKSTKPKKDKNLDKKILKRVKGGACYIKNSSVPMYMSPSECEIHGGDSSDQF